MSTNTQTALQAQGSHHDDYGIRVIDSVAGWCPNPRAATPFKTFRGHPNDAPESPFPSEDATARAKARLAAFSSKVKFGFGLARGGRHTYLYVVPADAVLGMVLPAACEKIE